MINNLFILSKKQILELYSGYFDENGEFVYDTSDGRKGVGLMRTQGTKYISVDRYLASSTYIMYVGYYDTNQKLISMEYLYDSLKLLQMPEGTEYLSFTFSPETLSIKIEGNGYVSLGNKIIPHYKEMQKKYSKENDQIFFRETIDGTIKLVGADFDLLYNCDLDDKISFDIYRYNTLFSTNTLSKTDCEFDISKRIATIKLTANDKYSKVLDAYDNTFDLVKLAIAINPITLTKRAYTQIYIQGSNTISNYFGGTFWEDEVSSAVDSEEDLQNKYYFAKGPKFQEIHLSGFNYDNFNTTFKCIQGESIWNATSYTEINGVKYENKASIKFTKVYEKGETLEGDIQAHKMSDDSIGGYTYSEEHYTSYPDYDIYRIEMYNNHNGTGLKLYQSLSLYANDSDFFLAQAGIQMIAISQEPPNKSPLPDIFYLGNIVINYQIWGRLLCDIATLSDGTPTYDLPYDDFATERANFKKCIGLAFKSGEDSIVIIKQSSESSVEPTVYGQNDYGEYFMPPYSVDSRYLPLARSTWGNTSIWISFYDMGSDTVLGFERWVKDKYTKYTLKDSYKLSSVIKAMLAKIDPSLKHDGTSEYSAWLYGQSWESNGYKIRGGCDIYISQKSNILAGEYTQAAQKAEITFEQLMNMLRDCFKCYWFIDDQRRFRIEHISYFMNGGSYYSNSQLILDLTQAHDKFNKKSIIYGQSKTSYDKTELTGRFEFAWMDDVTDTFGNMTVDINDNYIQKDKTDSISIEQFTPDIDFMLLSPSDFSEDGFALILAKNGEVPIVRNEFIDENQYNRAYPVYAQNWYASWHNLINNYLYDMPGKFISFGTNRLNSNISVIGVKKCMQQDIAYQSSIMPSELNLIRTEVGDGSIDEMSVNVDTNIIDLKLIYMPK